MHEVELSFAAGAVDAVVGGRVDMPAFEVDGIIVVGDARVLRVVVVVGNANSESRSVSPVVKVSSSRTVVVELRRVVERQSIAH